jgi:hypothetical protein
MDVTKGPKGVESTNDKRKKFIICNRTSSNSQFVSKRLCGMNKLINHGFFGPWRRFCNDIFLMIICDHADEAKWVATTVQTCREVVKTYNFFKHSEDEPT